MNTWSPRRLSLAAALLAACGGGPTPTADAPGPQTARAAPDSPPPDCTTAPEITATPPDLNAWAAASRENGAPPLVDLGGISGGFRAQLGVARISVRPAGGGQALPIVTLEGSTGEVVVLDTGDPQRWPTPLNALDDEPVRLGSPLGPVRVSGAFAVDVTGDGTPDAVLALSAAGQRTGPADEESFLSNRTVELANGYAALLVVDPMRRAAHTLPLHALHQLRVSGGDGTDRSHLVGFRASLPPPLPWTGPFSRAWQGVSRAVDALAHVQRQQVTAGTLRFAGHGYGAPFERAEACRLGP
jgi:hypothetical protein